jgi:hypothetical protein
MNFGKFLPDNVCQDDKGHVAFRSFSQKLRFEEEDQNSKNDTDERDENDPPVGIKCASDPVAQALTE